MADLTEFIKQNMELHKLTKLRVDQLESEVKELRRRLEGGAVYGPGTNGWKGACGGWVPDSLPVSPDSFNFKYKLGEQID